MSVTLAIDCAGPVGSVAAHRRGGASAFRQFADRRHAAELTPSVGGVLREIGATYRDIDRLVLADGPGSFTGLRIGFATALGIIQADPHIAVHVAPALAAAAWSVSDIAGDAPVAALFDALRGEVFAAIYHFRGGALEVVLPPTCVTMTAFASRPLGGAVATGDGADLYRAAVEAWTGRSPVSPPQERAGARALLQLLEIRGGTQLVGDLARYTPVYGREAEAQVRWERAHRRALPQS